MVDSNGSYIFRFCVSNLNDWLSSILMEFKEKIQILFAPLEFPDRDPSLDA